MKNASLTQDKSYRTALTVFLFLLYVLYMFTLDSVALSLYLLKSYGPLLVFAFIGISLYRRDYERKHIYFLGLAFILWYIITRIILGDKSLVRSSVTLIDLSVLYGLAFPFAKSSGDWNKRHIFDGIAIIYVITIAAASWLGVYYAVTDTGVFMPRSGSFYGLEGHPGRFQLLGQNPNHSAVLISAAIMLTIYLLARYWKRQWIAPAAIVFLGLYSALAITDSRASSIAFLVAVALVAAVLASRIRVSSKGLKFILIILIVCVSVFVCYKGLDIATEVIGRNEDTVQNREVSLDINKMSGRAEIYQAVIHHIQEQPHILIHGLLDNQVTEKVIEETGYEYTHVHNSYLQTLMLTGIPGLLFSLYLSLRLALATWKLFFTDAPLAEKFLPLIPIILLVTSLVESLVFVPFGNLYWSLTNFLFLFTSGYVLETSDQYRFPSRKTAEQT